MPPIYAKVFDKRKRPNPISINVSDRPLQPKKGFLNVRDRTPSRHDAWSEEIRTNYRVDRFAVRGWGEELRIKMPF
jgi:hypothetical protein